MVDYPAIIDMKTDEQKMNYLNTQLKNVYLRDIVNRYHLSSDEDLSELLDILASGISSLTNPLKLSNDFKSIKNSKISANTIDHHLYGRGFPSKQSEKI